MSDSSRHSVLFVAALSLGCAGVGYLAAGLFDAEGPKEPVGTGVRTPSEFGELVDELRELRRVLNEARMVTPSAPSERSPLESQADEQGELIEALRDLTAALNQQEARHLGVLNVPSETHVQALPSLHEDELASESQQILLADHQQILDRYGRPEHISHKLYDQGYVWWLYPMDEEHYLVVWFSGGRCSGLSSISRDRGF